MNSREYAAVNRCPYSAQLQEIERFGKWSAARQLAFSMRAQTRSDGCWAATANVSQYDATGEGVTPCRM